MDPTEQEKLSLKVFSNLWRSLQKFEKKRFDIIADGLAIFLMSFYETHDITPEEFDRFLAHLSLSYKRLLNKQGDDEKQS